ncbi:MAG: carbohydrate ABC transporter permease, partial [Propionicimonas sp.]|nr:carbohydrate ABC transporter permease [Propionicimonas sp.]
TATPERLGPRGGESRRSRRRSSTLQRGIGILVYLVLAIMLIGVLLPLLWMVISGLKTNNEVFTAPWGLPAEANWGTFATAWTSGVSQYIWNSVLVTILSLVIVIAVACCGAYALSFLRLPGTGVLSLVVIGGMMLAPPVAMVPLFQLFQSLHLLDNLFALSVLYAAYRLPMSLFIIRAYMLTLPRELSEAASIDGANSVQTLWSIVLPICKPAIVSAAIMHLLFAWNEFPFALVLISSPENQTLPVGLLNLQSDLTTDWPVVFAGMTIAALPMIVLYLSAQRQFVRGAADGSLK